MVDGIFACFKAEICMLRIGIVLAGLACHTKLRTQGGGQDYIFLALFGRYAGKSTWACTGWTLSFGRHYLGRLELLFLGFFKEKA
jgi:hypothetical protein